MAKTSDYVDYLDSEIGIAPANSQEEFQAAETVVEIMRDHDLEPTIQEFDAHPLGALLPDILAVVMFVGVLLCGLGSTALRLIGLVLALVPAALLIMRHLGHDVLSEAGPASRSQNVIAVHRATGDKVTKGNRPIVVIAHYDTPRESPLFERLATYQARLRKATVPGVIVAALAALLQLFGFLPGGLRLVLWIVGIVAMVPSLVVAVSEFVEKASPCTTGANDNKASVAALLGLIDKVAPRDDRASGTSGAEEESTAADEPTSPSMETSAVGVRHGKEVLEELGILPETCEIVYETTPSEEPQESQDDGPADEGEAPLPVTDDESPDGGEYAHYAYDDNYGEPVDDSYEDIEAEGAQDVDVSSESIGTEETSAVDDASYDQGYGDEPGGYEEETYGETPDDEAESWSEEAWEDEDSQALDGPSAQSASSGGRVKGFFASLKERLSHKAKGADVSIPRGTGDEGIDYSEFEETDWGEDDWSDESDTSQDELMSISRDDLVARRAASKTQGDQDGQYGEEVADAEPPTDYGSYEADQVTDAVDGQYYDEEEAQPQETGGYTPADTEEVEPPQEEEQPAPEARTSHDISHESGPDWSIVEDEESVAAVQASTTDPAVYQKSEESADDELDLGADDLVEIEEELDEDQVASAPIRPRQPLTGHKKGTDGPQDTPDAESAAQVAEDAAKVEDDAQLSWDEDEGADGNEDNDVLPKDSRGLDTISDDYDAFRDDSEGDDLEEPDPIDDPTWGETSYVPPRPKDNVARRATLYDVPNPSDDAVDPLDDACDDDVPADESQNANNQEGPNGSSGSDSKRASDWKGGAAIRSDLRDEGSQSNGDVSGSEDAYGSGDNETSYASEDSTSDDGWQHEEVGGEPDQVVIDQDDLQDAILNMGDDLLVSHDIWFVAAGASSVGHAGVKAFLSDFRQDIRGAFLINLDSVGAGELTILTSEGLDEGRRADRRLVRLITSVADDLHLPLAKRSYDWSDTDATAAMRSRVRSVTIMGMDQNGLPALSHTPDDVPENVDPKQVASVVRMVAEAIRRS